MAGARSLPCPAAPLPCRACPPVPLALPAALLNRLPPAHGPHPPQASPPCPAAPAPGLPCAGCSPQPVISPPPAPPPCSRQRDRPRDDRPAGPEHRGRHRRQAGPGGRARLVPLSSALLGRPATGRSPTACACRWPAGLTGMRQQAAQLCSRRRKGRGCPWTPPGSHLCAACWLWWLSTQSTLVAPHRTHPPTHPPAAAAGSGVYAQGEAGGAALPGVSLPPAGVSGVPPIAWTDGELALEPPASTPCRLPTVGSRSPASCCNNARASRLQPPVPCCIESEVFAFPFSC